MTNENSKVWVITRQDKYTDGDEWDPNVEVVAVCADMASAVARRMMLGNEDVRVGEAGSWAIVSGSRLTDDGAPMIAGSDVMRVYCDEGEEVWRYLITPHEVVTVLS